MIEYMQAEQPTKPFLTVYLYVQIYPHLMYYQMIHRITELFELEGTLKTIWFQPPCHGQGHLPLEQAA